MTLRLFRTLVQVSKGRLQPSKYWLTIIANRTESSGSSSKGRAAAAKAMNYNWQKLRSGAVADDDGSANSGNAVAGMKTIRPVGSRKDRSRRHQVSSVKESQDNENVITEEEIKMFKKAMEEEFQTKGDLGESDIDVFNTGYSDHLKEQYRKYTLSQRNTAFRKYFRKYTVPEINVLTYAEKMHIRHLHDLDPVRWNLEALSEKFPISVDGVSKLLKSKLKLRSLKEIQAHDERLAERIKRLKESNSPLDSVIIEKLKWRESVPLKIGLCDPYDKSIMISLDKPKTIGEFERLVSPHRNVEEPKTDNQVKLPDTNKDPEIGDYLSLKRNPKLTVLSPKYSNKHMTFKEFVNKLNSSSVPEDNKAEVEYIKQLASKPHDPDYDTSKNDLVRESVSYYKVDAVEANSEEQNVQLADEGEKIFKLDVPLNSNNSGVVYRKGNTYYDEKGEFLFRVV